MKPLAALAAWTLLAGVVYGQPAIPATGAALAKADWDSRGNPAFIRYLWSPTASDVDYQAAAIALNVAVNQGSTEYKPPRVAGGAFILVDLTQLVDDEKQLTRLVGLWDSLAEHDPYFHLVIHNEIKATKTSKGKTETVVSIAPHVAVAIPVGLVYRTDQFVASVLSSIDGGSYLRFRSLEAGKTKLEDYLTSRGASLKQAQKLNAVDSGVQLSDVTGKVRAWSIFHGQGVKPSVGRPLVSITFDVADGPLSPDRNAFLSLLNEKFDASELILTLPTGQQEFTLWSGAGTLLAEAAANVVTDHSVPTPFTNRLQSAASCLRCHGPSNGLQPLRNDILPIVAANGRILSDLSKGADKQFEALRIIQSRFGARQVDIDGALFDSKNSLSRRFDAIAGTKTENGAKEAYANTMRVFDSYRYQWVSPAIAATELGLVAGAEPADTLRAAMPAPNPLGAIAEGSAGVLAQLEAGLSITRDDWEQTFPDAMSKALVSLKQQAAKAGPNLMLPKPKVVP